MVAAAGATPVTAPLLSTVATDGSELVHARRSARRQLELSEGETSARLAGSRFPCASRKAGVMGVADPMRTSPVAVRSIRATGFVTMTCKSPLTGYRANIGSGAVA